MRIHCLQHVAFEGPGSIAAWAQRRGIPLHTTLLGAGQPFPEMAQEDWLLVMGGPMGANDDDRYAWLAPEKDLIRRAITADQTVIGICLGAQLMAAALGAGVRSNGRREIGWFPIERTSAAIAGGHLDVIPQGANVFHWHGDTFDIPAGCVHLVRSAACAHQAFLAGERAFGLQFHLETTVESARALIAHCAEEMTPGEPFIQSAAQIMAAPERFAAINGWMEAFLEQQLARPR